MEIVTAQPVAPIGTEGEESALLSSVRSGDRRAAERLVEASYSSVFASLC
jgi:hypothetical protein